MKAVWQRFWQLHFLLKIIWIFCFLGFLFNTQAIWRDLHGNGILIRLHIGFWLLYTGQVVFILLRERMVFILSLLQALLALETSLDFTFVPLNRLLGQLLVLIHGTLSIDAMETYKYMFVSICFTLELLKTFFLWELLPSRVTAVKEEQSAEQ